MLELTNYEMLELANSHIANATDDLNRLAAAVTAYLMVAYRVGKDLTRFQVFIISVFFLVITLQAGFGAGGENGMAIAYWKEVLGPQAASENVMVAMGAPYLIGFGLIACLAFMWRVRHPKTE